MRQLTLRGFEPELAAAISDLAEAEGISLNQAALRLLRKGVGLDEFGRQRNRIGARLDRFIDTMSDEEEREILEAVAEADRIDLELDL